MRKIKYICGVFIAMLLLLSAPCYAYAAPLVPVNLDGVEVASGVLENNRTLVPIRALAENMGYLVEWDEQLQKVSIADDDVQYILYIDSQTAYAQKGEKSETVVLDVAPKIINSRTYVPLRYVAEGMGRTVFWQADIGNSGGSVLVNTPMNITLYGQTFLSNEITEAEALEKYGSPYDELLGADGVRRLIYMNSNSMSVLGFYEDHLFEFFTNAADAKIDNVAMTHLNAETILPDTMHLFTDSFENDKPVGLYFNAAGKLYSPHRNDNGKQLTMQQEAKLTFYLTNSLRTLSGKQNLVFSDALAEVDRGHVFDMAEHNFFSHSGLNGDRIKERIKTAGAYANYMRVSEILARVPNAYYACYGWLNSESHRAAMLYDAYDYTGICVDGNLDEYLYYAQVLVKLK